MTKMVVTIGSRGGWEVTKVYTGTFSLRRVYECTPQTGKILATPMSQITAYSEFCCCEKVGCRMLLRVTSIENVLSVDFVVSVYYRLDFFDILFSLVVTRNSSGDEIANVNFLYNNIVHALQNTIDWCINSAIDRRGYVFERMCLPNSVK